LMFLLGALIVYRIGAHIPVPGIDPSVLSDLFSRQKDGILGMFIGATLLSIGYRIFMAWVNDGLANAEK